MFEKLKQWWIARQQLRQNIAFRDGYDYAWTQLMMNEHSHRQLSAYVDDERAKRGELTCRAQGVETALKRFKRTRNRVYSTSVKRYN